mmetsp:Transcript_10463/g.12000  ORF Transcript_10463/g.12000 Transcript_10463/m.12000 type:complete len:255 (+) Transcript_10463:98-862(+)
MAAAVTSTIAEALKAVRKRMSELVVNAGRSSENVRLVAVSKTKPKEMIMEAYDADQRHFGENYVQDFVEKAPHLPLDIKWHFIGHLQSNKVKEVYKIPNLFMVETVDTKKLADVLNRRFPEDRKEKLRVLVQVNTSGEESKSGVEPSSCSELVKHIVENCDKLLFSGLMTIGRLGDTSTECFETLAQCKEEVLKIDNLGVSSADFELSMGMSGDYDIAIAAGSTNIRVGSTIFGARAKKEKAPNAATSEMKAKA